MSGRVNTMQLVRAGGGVRAFSFKELTKGEGRYKRSRQDAE